MSSRFDLLAAALFVIVPAIPTVQAATDAPRYGGGETWSYRVVDGYNGLPRGTYTETVASVSAGEIRIEAHSGDATASNTLTFTAPGLLSAGSLSTRARGRMEPALQLLPFPLEEGQRWRQHVMRIDPASMQKRDVTVSGKVEGWENVKVPAGEFRALKIVRVMYLGDHDAFRTQARLTEYEWYVPELKHWVKLQNFEEYHEAFDNAAGPYKQGERQVFELLSAQPGKR